MQKKNIPHLVIILAGLLFISAAVVFSQYKNNQTKPSSNKSARPAADVARDNLVRYFNLLNVKNYKYATELHGSGYVFLQEWNPDTPISDHVGLLKLGCEQNGLQCLRILNILSQERTSANTFTFKVQFANADGTLFKRGPCCGATETEMPTQTDFDFVVKKVNNSWLVTTQPVYMP